MNTVRVYHIFIEVPAPHCTRLYYTVLYCTILCYTVLYCAILCYTVLYCSILYYTVLYCTILYSTVLYCTILYYTVLYSIVLGGGDGMIERKGRSELYCAGFLGPEGLPARIYSTVHWSRHRHCTLDSVCTVYNIVQYSTV